jgi:hypothetical protein
MGVEHAMGSHWVRETFAVHLVLTLFLAACGSDKAASPETEPTCLDKPANLDCKPLYGLQADGGVAPTFQQVFDTTLPNCATSDSCHKGPNAQRGLRLDQIDSAYTNLLATNAQHEQRVIPGDVKCGKVIVRLESIDKPWSMPPGGHLGESDLCSFRHWIANGAKR